MSFFSLECIRQNISLAQVPTQAGSLNAEHLLHQAVTLKQGKSPEYLQHSMVPVETSLALER